MKNPLVKWQAYRPENPLVKWEAHRPEIDRLTMLVFEMAENLYKLERQKRKLKAEVKRLRGLVTALEADR